MIDTIRDIWQKRTIVGHFVSAQLTTSYRTKSFGFVWALLDPLLFMGVYYLVFGKILAHRPLSFMLHLFVGVITFRFLNSSLSQAASIMRGQAGLIREIRFPKAALPLSIVLARLFDLGAGWLVAIPLAIIFGSPPTAFWLLVPLVIVIQALFVLGLSLLLAYVGVFFADIANILGVVLRLWFYMSPVLYPLALVQSKTETRPLLFKLYMLNPMANILDTLGSLVERAQLPDSGQVIYALVVGLSCLLLGIFIFARAEGQIGKYV